MLEIASSSIDIDRSYRLIIYNPIFYILIFIIWRNIRKKDD